MEILSMLLIRKNVDLQAVVVVDMEAEEDMAEEPEEELEDME
jgi:hypothetical protein